MQLDITDYVSSTDHCLVSASVAELGANAGRITWQNAMEESKGAKILESDDAINTARDWLEGFGAWSRDELDSMTSEEVRALILQFISGDIREAESLAPGDGAGGIDWEAYGDLASHGTCPGRCYLGDDDRVYFYLGD